MKFLVILLVTLLILQIESSSILLSSVQDFDVVADHYWRDYTGLVPSDAIVGGVAETGDSTYIGQFTLTAQSEGNGALVTVPAIIIKGSIVALGTYSGLSPNSTHDSNTKVLCSSGATSRYKWYSPKVVIPPRCHFIVGGLEDAVPLYIARAKVDRATLIGKVFANGRHDSNIIVPARGTELYLDTYEVLTYCY